MHPNSTGLEISAVWILPDLALVSLHLAVISILYRVLEYTDKTYFCGLKKKKTSMSWALKLIKPKEWLLGTSYLQRS